MQESSPSEARCDVDGGLAVSVALIDVDRGHGEKFLEALQVVLLDRTENRGQHEIVLLERQWR